MTHADHVATAEVTIDAPAQRVWDALADPDRLPDLWFGATVRTSWQTGSPITWEGVWNDSAYRRLAESIKDAVDPAGVLSPGRHGIWPKRYRDD